MILLMRQAETTTPFSTLLLSFLLICLVIAVIILVVRWVFRVNKIVYLLEDIYSEQKRLTFRLTEPGDD